MPVKNIERLLSSVPGKRRCLLGITNCETYRDLIQTAVNLRKNLAVMAGARIAISGLSPAELSIAITAFDGIAYQILILPLSLTDDVREKLIADSSSTHLIRSGFEYHSLTADTTENVVSETKWLLATSGTTGVPKLITHTLATLTRTVNRNLDNGHGYVWGLLYDSSRFAGIQVILQALLSGSSLVVSEGSDFKSQLAVMLKHSVNALSATPTLWRKLLMHGKCKELPLRQITLGGEIVDQAVLDALGTFFPNARIVHIYASTEAGSSFAVKDGKSGFPSDWIDNPKIIPSLKVAENSGHLLIKSPLLAQGKEIELRLTDDGYLDTEDLVRVEDDRVVFLGRVSGAINVGGNKVNPESLEVYLRSINGVVDAHVYGKANSIIGQLVVANVIPASHVANKVLRQRISESCRRDLEAWQVPAFINFTKELDETAAGKRMRVEI